jgi:hypothetical protein
MRPLTHRCALVALVIALMALPGAASARDGGGPTAQAARGCHLSAREQRHLGTTYVLRVSVSHVSCRSGKRLVRAYHSCRHRHGGADGHCRSVSGYRCSERRFNKSRFSFDARASCSRGGRKVSQTYTQNL